MTCSGGRRGAGDPNPRPIGRPIKADDHERRFFEAAWLHKYQGRYYLSYSTGNTHLLVYAIGDNPYGPFTYQGVMLTPVIGWTTHHSIVEYKGEWYLFTTTRPSRVVRRTCAAPR